MYAALDIFFLVFHTVLTLFNVFGWLFKKTRKWNLFTLIITALSWFVLGIWYGWGYCPCTDWHWSVREKLGYENDPASYIQFLVRELTGADVSPALTDVVTVVVFFLSLAMSLYLNVSDYLRRTRS